MANEIFYPHKEIFKNPIFKNMCEYEDKVKDFEKDYERTGRTCKNKINLV